MNLLTPLGLLGLLAVAVLIVIYVIRPSYQNKSIPSTYIWKESLKYRKRQKPGNLFRNLLIILCQILLLSICALILATPFLQTRSAKDVDQNIIVIDASANMLAASGGTTRFGRAVSRAKEFAAESVRDKKLVSVILAGTRANCVVSKEVSIDIIEEKLNEAVCSYGSGDVAGAMKLAGDLTADSYAQVYFYTATAYENAGDIAVVNVSSEEDWNACALDLRAESEENYFEFSADVAVYGKDKYLKLSLSVEGVNGDGRTVRAEKRVNCTDGETVTVTFADLDIYGYESASLSIAVDDGTADSFPYDDSFFLYGGKKETIRIQYASSLPNNFLSGALLVLKNRYRDQWDIEISEPTKSKDIETSGFDFYIFEHAMPSAMPTDGVVILVDPDQIPRGLELSLGQIRKTVLSLESEWSVKNLDFDIALPKIDFFGNEGLLYHVWYNLIGNAIKFSYENQTIKISMEKTDSEVIVVIADSGCGMEEDAQRHIFEKFYQADKTHSKKGNGLGLTLVKRIIDLCNGHITVESQLHKGSVFIVRLPAE